MAMPELPKALQQEFEYTANLLYDQDSVKQALVEAVELWLAQQRQKLIQAEAKVNNQAFEAMKAELEQNYHGQWIVIAHGKLQGVADVPEDLNDLAPNARHRIVTQVGQTHRREVELGWQMTFN